MLGLWLQIKGSPLAQNILEVTSLIMLIELFIAMLFSLALLKATLSDLPLKQSAEGKPLGAAIFSSCHFIILGVILNAHFAY